MEYLTAGCSYPKNSNELKVYAFNQAISLAPRMQIKEDEIISLSEKIYNHLGGDDYVNEDKSNLEDFVKIISLLPTVISEIAKMKFQDQPQNEYSGSSQEC